jgi:hypothetical protein
MGRLKHKWGDHASLMRLNPARSADAPLVTRFQSLKSVLGSRGAEVVPDLFLKIKEFDRDSNTGRVFARIFSIRFTTAISKEPGERIAGAGSKWGS